MRHYENGYKNFHVGWIQRVIVHPSCYRQRGSALIMVLIFVFVMTRLLLSLMETGLFASKMSQHFYEKQVAFIAAEAGLIREEMVIQHQWFPLPKSEAKIITTLKLIDEDVCHKKRYQITSSAEYYRAKVVLESIYDYLPHPTAATCVVEKSNQRIFWHEFSNAVENRVPHGF